MERMFPQPKEFVKVDTFVVKDKNAPYARYYNFQTGNWGGLLLASRLTKEELNNENMPENGEVMLYDKVIGV